MSDTFLICPINVLYFDKHDQVFMIFARSLTMNID
jgi:hypothetical protein